MLGTQEHYSGENYLSSEGCGMAIGIFNKHILVGVEENGEIRPEDNGFGKKLDSWLKNGVPGLVSSMRGDKIIEKERTIATDHPLFGLALLEHFERIGWEVKEIKGDGRGTKHLVHDQSTHGRKMGAHPGWPVTETVDTTKWPAHNVAAKYAAKKIAKIEKAAAEGDWDFVLSVHIKSKVPNSYQKGILKAKEVVLAKHQKKSATQPKADGLKYEGKYVNADGWKKVSGKLGTQEGGKFVADDGKTYYVKFPSDPKIAVNELITNKLYEAAGSPVAKAHLVKRNGEVGFASEWISDAQKAKWGTHEHRDLAAQDFATHAWLANWDCVGHVSEMDNIRVVGSGPNAKALTVDVGGGMFYRAQGAEKTFGAKVAEWDTLRDQSINPSGAKVFGNMTKQQLLASAQKVTNVSDEVIDGICQKYGGMHGLKTPATLATRLKKRRDAIEDRMLNLMGSASPKKVPKPKPGLVQTPEGKLAKSVPIGPTVKSPPTINSKYNGPIYQPKFNKLHELASQGKWDEVANFKTNPNAKQCYAKKLHQYKQDLLQAAGQGGKVEKATTPVKSKYGKAPKIDTSLFPEEPVFVSKDQAHIAQNKAAVKTALKYAKAGDVDALKGMELPPSPKLKAFHEDLVMSLSSQLHPSPPAKKLSKSLAKIDKLAAPIVGSKGRSHQSKVGKYLVLGEANPVPSSLKVVEGEWLEPSWSAGKSSYNKLSDAERDAVVDYTGGGYDSMNKRLRGHGKLQAHDLNAARGVTKAAIDLTPGKLLSRKHNLSPKSAKALLKSVGKVIQDRGIVSTSTSPYVWSGNVVWKLKVGPGVKGLPSRLFSDNAPEDEVILPPNTRYLVTKAKEKDGIYHMEGVILPFHPSQCCPP